MPKDNRFYITIAIDFDEHPKYAELSDAQKYLIIRALLYCRRNNTDGFVPKGVWTKMASKRDRTLVENVDGVTTSVSPPGIFFDDYLEHQMSRAEVEALAEKRSSAGKKGGEAKARNASKEGSNPLASATASAKQTSSKDVAETETETEESANALSTAAAAAAFDRFWSVYPRKHGKKPAKAKWDIAIRKTDPATIIDGAIRYASDPNRSDEYTKLAQTWLHNECWDDPALPKRLSSIKKTATERANEYLNLGGSQPAPSPTVPPAIRGYGDPFAIESKVQDA